MKKYASKVFATASLALLSTSALAGYPWGDRGFLGMFFFF